MAGRGHPARVSLAGRRTRWLWGGRGVWVTAEGGGLVKGQEGSEQSGGGSSGSRGGLGRVCTWGVCAGGSGPCRRYGRGFFRRLWGSVSGLERAPGSRGSCLGTGGSRATGRCRHRNEHAGIEVVASKPLHVSPVGLQFGGFEPGDSLPVPVGPAFLNVHPWQPLPLAVRGSEDHGVVGPELREPVVAPISGTTSLHDTHHAERPQVDPAEFAGQGGAPFNWSPAATPADQHRSSCCGRIGDKVGR